MTDAPGRRRYTLRRRAERQAETGARILDAALARYAEVGPARTTVSAVADGAGVERLTVYRHYPNEAALVTAAVGHLLAAKPLPDMAAWFAERNPRRRLERGLTELFGFYGACGAALGNLLRDMSEVPAAGPALEELLQPLTVLPGALADGWPTFGDGSRERLRVAIRHALAFDTWRSLTADGGLGDREAARLLARLAAAAARDED